jgi:hypothetical protein
MSSSKQEVHHLVKGFQVGVRAFLDLKVSMNNLGKEEDNQEDKEKALVIYLKNLRNSLEAWEEVLGEVVLKELRPLRAKILCCH